MSTNHGVCKDNELIWYDNFHVMSMKFDDEMRPNYYKQNAKNRRCREMKLDEKMEDCGMELTEQVLTAEEQEELAQESDEENAKR